MVKELMIPLSMVTGFIDLKMFPTYYRAYSQKHTESVKPDRALTAVNLLFMQTHAALFIGKVETAAKSLIKLYTVLLVCVCVCVSFTAFTFNSVAFRAGRRHRSLVSARIACYF